MFEVIVMSAGVVIDSMTFFSEVAAEVWAGEMQDRGYTVRFV